MLSTIFTYSGRVLPGLSSFKQSNEEATPEEVVNVNAFLRKPATSPARSLLSMVEQLSRKWVGDLVRKRLRSTPREELKLRHSRDGLRNKETHRIKRKK
jgi:hypothetical protein